MDLTLLYEKYPRDKATYVCILDLSIEINDLEQIYKDNTDGSLEKIVNLLRYRRIMIFYNTPVSNIKDHYPIFGPDQTLPFGMSEPLDYRIVKDDDTDTIILKEIYE